MRVIARLDIKNEYVIKGINFEGLRRVGNPNNLAKKYYQEGTDEIIFMDSVASLYGRNNLFSIIQEACEEVMIPITVGGGLRTMEDIKSVLHAGADKVAINTAAVKNPFFISEVAEKYGSQCIVASIEAKKVGNHWEVYVDNGREKTGLDVLEWALKLQSLGAGEILLTSVDHEGMRQGFDNPLIKLINEVVTIPVIASGGAGNVTHLEHLLDFTCPSAVAFASLLHYNLALISAIKEKFLELNIQVRV